MIKFECPECGVKLNAPYEMAGETANCPECNKEIKVPS